MDTPMTYDERLKRAEEIVKELEEAEAIDMDTYKKLAAEATSLLDACKKEITGPDK